MYYFFYARPMPAELGDRANAVLNGIEEDNLGLRDQLNISRLKDVSMQLIWKILNPKDNKL